MLPFSATLPISATMCAAAICRTKRAARLLRCCWQAHRRGHKNRKCHWALACLTHPNTAQSHRCAHRRSDIRQMRPVRRCGSPKQQWGLHAGWQSRRLAAHSHWNLHRATQSDTLPVSAHRCAAQLPIWHACMPERAALIWHGGVQNHKRAAPDHHVATMRQPPGNGIPRSPQHSAVPSVRTPHV